MLRAVKDESASNGQVRRMKIYPFYRFVENWVPFRLLPHIRLCGNWLENAGFYPGDTITVTVSEGMLVIRKAEIV